MQMLLDFGLTPSEYASGDVEYPVISRCPMCGAEKRLIGHGYYFRSAVLRLYDHLRLKIKRLLCTLCRKTLSLLPWFVLPQFQYGLQFIIDSLLRRAPTYRQLLQQHRRRFVRNLNAIQAFLRDLGFNASLPRAPDEKAIKLLWTIENMGLAVFSALYQKRFHRSFMAT